MHEAVKHQVAKEEVDKRKAVEDKKALKKKKYYDALRKDYEEARLP